MRHLRFHRAVTLQDLLECQADPGTRGRLLAGGTDLMVELREGTGAQDSVTVIDITALPGLDAIAEEEAPRRIRIGALATHTAVSAHPLLRRWAPLLCSAVSQIGSPLIRNRATLGGNLCNAAPCADSAPPLLALEAELTLRSMRGERRLALAEAVRAPYETVLAEDEVLIEVAFTMPAEPPRAAFVKLGRRRALSISRMSVAVLFHLDRAGSMTGVRVAGGSLTPTPRRFARAEEVLEGQMPGEDLFREAGAMLSGEMIQITGRRWSTPYKEPVAAALLERALKTAVAPRSTGDGHA